MKIISEENQKKIILLRIVQGLVIVVTVFGIVSVAKQLFIISLWCVIMLLMLYHYVNILCEPKMEELGI